MWRYTFSVNDLEEGWHLRGFLRSRDVSTTLLRQLKMEEGLWVNGRKATLDVVLHPGDVVEIRFAERSDSSILPEPVPIRVVMEDEDLLLLNKPSGIAVHPTLHYASGTLANGIAHYWACKGEKRLIRFVNRLDKETSGIVVVAKNGYAHHFLVREMKRGEYRKWYDLFVHGIVTEEEGEIHLPIGLEEGSIIKRRVQREGLEAKTKFRVIRRYQEKQVTWIEAELLTGRTHQIRVHFSHLGYPLLGDDLYGGERLLIHRQALHAAKVELVHPREEEKRSFYAPWPEDLNQLVEKLERVGRD